MFRKIALLVSIVAIFSMAIVVQGAGEDGCYVTTDAPLVGDPAAPQVNEDQDFTVTVRCDDVPTGVAGIQVGTSWSGNFVNALLAATYTQGEFYNWATDPLAGTNSLTATGLYALARSAGDVEDATSFTVASFDMMAIDTLTADGSITINFDDEDFLLSDEDGLALLDQIRTINDVTVTVNDIDLAWLNGDAVVRSDVSTIASVNSVSLAIGGKTYNVPASGSTYTYTFDMDATYQYEEALSPDSDGTLLVNVSADMTGHMACSTSNVNLGDTGTATNVDSKVGNSGVITLLAGDADDDDDIDNADATLIGANYGVEINDEKDINGDDELNVLDLVHVGRNIDAPPASCNS